MDNLWIIYGYGWWVFPYPSEKSEFVNWDDEIRNRWENKSHVPNHQTVENDLQNMGKESEI